MAAEFPGAGRESWPRQSWELPGGRIDEGESTRQAATRELLEESGQKPDGPLQFLGYAGFTLAPTSERNTQRCSQAAHRRPCFPCQRGDRGHPLVGPPRIAPWTHSTAGHPPRSAHAPEFLTTAFELTGIPSTATCASTGSAQRFPSSETWGERHRPGSANRTDPAGL
ncbi:NUDIX hydrolase [Streptomyces halobius]|uniref:NUDIX domain-containing protein n=1 Tax=Streptomyces halobius TaxID=2879846 RepID=A0ABY4M4X7_9ACTN|nr:NUDIX domain-containing protein [Streptomyces halobius]UQA91874.1 NUDIX domain-containing protein [Streptomyces halobius]